MKTRALAAILTSFPIAVILWMNLRPAIPSVEIRKTPPTTTAVSPSSMPDRSVAKEVPPAVGETFPQPSPPTLSQPDLAKPPVPPTVQGAVPSFPSNVDPAAIARDLDKITLMFRDYRTITGGNPVGTNAEIMKSLMGGNPKGAMLGPPEGQSLNENGELIDHWGTPYFFHQLSRDLMEIHSAGPDRIMWTADDVIGK